MKRLHNHDIPVDFLLRSPLTFSHCPKFSPASPLAENAPVVSIQPRYDRRDGNYDKHSSAAISGHFIVDDILHHAIPSYCKLDTEFTCTWCPREPYSEANPEPSNADSSNSQHAGRWGHQPPPVRDFYVSAFRKPSAHRPNLLRGEPGLHDHFASALVVGNLDFCRRTQSPPKGNSRR